MAQPDQRVTDAAGLREAQLARRGSAATRRVTRTTVSPSAPLRFAAVGDAAGPADVMAPGQPEASRMRIAVIADIHGNILALEAVLADLARRGGADLFINLGDCVSGPLWPRETVERLMSLGWPTVRGNHDRRVRARSARSEMGPSDHIRAMTG